MTQRYLGQAEIEHRFGFHKATIEGENATLPKHRELRLLYVEFGMLLDDILPGGRAKDIALQQLEDASMWSHKAVAELDPLVPEYAEQVEYAEEHSRGVVDQNLPDYDELRDPEDAPVAPSLGEGRTLCEVGRPYRDHVKKCSPSCDWHPALSGATR